MSTRDKDRAREYGIAYRAKNAAREKSRKAEWYKQNRAEIVQRRKARRGSAKASCVEEQPHDHEV